MKNASTWWIFWKSTVRCVLKWPDWARDVISNVDQCDICISYPQRNLLPKPAYSLVLMQRSWHSFCDCQTDKWISRERERRYTKEARTQTRLTKWYLVSFHVCKNNLSKDYWLSRSINGFARTKECSNFPAVHYGRGLVSVSCS